MVGEYAALFVLAAVSAVGIPGPGDSALIAAGLLAADGDLALPGVLITAFIACVLGRALGFWIGSARGRALVGRPGPLHGFRQRTLEKGDDLFRRFPRFAPLLVPAVLCGIYRVPWRVFAGVSLIVTTTWTLSTGLGGYFLGPPAADILTDIGIKGAVAVAIVAAFGLLGRYLWRLRRPA